MSWWMLLILYVVSWLLIMILEVTADLYGKYVWQSALDFGRTVDSSSDFYLTGILYFIGNLLCIFIDWSVLHWALMIIGIVIALPQAVLSLIGFVPALFDGVKRTLEALAALICDFVPLFMAFNIYIVHIAK